ncbi:MAG TPA: hypothetical protein VGD46_09240 [Rhizobacter sp.]
MNLLPRWMRLDSNRQAAADEPDPGDMGTAFGLDASLGPLEDDPSVSAPADTGDSRWRERLDRRPRR